MITRNSFIKAAVVCVAIFWLPLKLLAAPPLFISGAGLVSTKSHMAIVDGSAMLWDEDNNLSTFAGDDAGSTPYSIVLTDSAGKTCRGYIGAVGAGELLDVETLTNNSFTGTWGANDLPQGWKFYSSSPDANNYLVKDDANDRLQFIFSGGPAFGIYQATATVGALYKMVTVTDSITAGKRYYFGFSAGASLHIVTASGTKTSYQTCPAATTRLLARMSGYSCDAIVSATSIKKVLDIPATGVHLHSTEGGVDRKVTIDTGFNPNSVPMKIRIYRVH